MTSETKITKAKTQLLLRHPFYASMALRLKMIPDPAIKTACTNGVYIKYNPAFIDKLELEEVIGLIAHEVMHVALCHHTRRQNRDPQLWNQAADFAINPIIISSGMIMPPNGLIEDAYKDLSAEEIYNLLQANPGSAPAANNGLGDVEDLPPDIDEKYHEAQIKLHIEAAKQIAQHRDNIPDVLKRLVDELLKPKVNWYAELSEFIAQVSADDYNYSLPAARYLHRGLYLPSLCAVEYGPIAVIIDTSGSIEDSLINQFAGEIQEITTLFNVPVLVIYVDTAVRGIQELQPDEPIQLIPAGGGNTDFIPGFTYLKEHDIEVRAVVYLTDGLCDTFPQEPDYPVLWAIFGDYPFQPPFGQVIPIDLS